MVTKERLFMAYKQVFGTEDGRIVLSDILSMLGYFANVPERINPQCIAAANTILSRCGIIDAGGNGVMMEGIGYAMNLVTITAEKAEMDKEDTDDL